MPYAENQGVKIHYQVEGEGIPVVLLHGFLNDCQTWYEINYVHSLKPYCQLILIDSRGYGKSDKLYHQDEYFLIHRVRDVLAVMDAMRINKAHIFGYSMGGRIAFGFTKYAPERLLSLIIGGMGPYKMPIDLTPRVEMLQQGMETIVDDLEKRNGKLPQEVKDRILQNDPKALIADTKDTIEWNGVDERLETISVPVLYFVGDQDYFLEDAKRASDRIKDVEFVILEDMNHNDAYVKKTAILPHIMAFLHIGT